MTEIKNFDCRPGANSILSDNILHSTNLIEKSTLSNISTTLTKNEVENGLPLEGNFTPRLFNNISNTSDTLDENIQKADQNERKAVVIENGLRAVSDNERFMKKSLSITGERLQFFKGKYDFIIWLLLMAT